MVLNKPWAFILVSLSQFHGLSGKSLKPTSSGFKIPSKVLLSTLQGRIQGGAHPARAPPKIGKNMIFWRKIVIFHTKYLKNFRASLGN